MQYLQEALKVDVAVENQTTIEKQKSSILVEIDANALKPTGNVVICASVVVPVVAKSARQELFYKLKASKRKVERHMCYKKDENYRFSKKCLIAKV